MSKYIQSTLVSGEEVVQEAKISIWSQTPLMVLGVALLPVYGIGLICFVIVYLRYISTELAFTNKRVIAKFGFISRGTIELQIDKVGSLSMRQGILGRIFNFGSIVITGYETAVIPSISNPMQFRKEFMEYQNQLREGTA